MLILGIETSCDETAASVIKITEAPTKYEFKRITNIKILSNIVSSQISIHRAYGGIVPEVAARAHIENILPVLKKALTPLADRNIDLIAVTAGPGLVTSLLVGVEVAKTLAYVWKKPLIPINHLIAHIYANWLSPISPSPSVLGEGQFPAVCLVVSGGHTKLILMEDFEKFKEIGGTRDDAAGECFDKIAKLLGLGYPGGPVIAAEAAKMGTVPIWGQSPKLPRPMISSGDFDFSFSGLKTAVLYLVPHPSAMHFKKCKALSLKGEGFISAVCAEVQQAIIDVLVTKTIRAAREFKARSVILAGGVAANSQLRKQLESRVQSLRSKVNFLVPPKNLCTDNAAMIAAAGYFKFIKTREHKNKKTKAELLKIFDWSKIKVNPNLEIEKPRLYQ